MANIYDMADTWNDGATTFTAIKMNVTDTASDASSLLMDLQVGGVSKFSVAKGTGAVFGANLIEQRNSTNAQTFNIYNTYTDASNYERGFMKWNSNVLEIGTEAAGTGTVREVKFISGDTFSFQRADFTSPPKFRHRASNILDVYLGSSAFYSFNTSVAFQLEYDMQFAWGSTNSDSTADTGIKRDSAGIVKVTDGSTGGGTMQLDEITAPSGKANAVRIYAEDNGSGKTRLMAIFGTGAAQQIAIEP